MADVACRSPQVRFLVTAGDKLKPGFPAMRRKLLFFSIVIIFFPGWAAPSYNLPYGLFLIRDMAITPYAGSHKSVGFILHVRRVKSRLQNELGTGAPPDGSAPPKTALWEEHFRQRSPWQSFLYWKKKQTNAEVPGGRWEMAANAIHTCKKWMIQSLTYFYDSYSRTERKEK